MWTMTIKPDYPIWLVVDKICCLTLLEVKSVSSCSKHDIIYAQLTSSQLDLLHDVYKTQVTGGYN